VPKRLEEINIFSAGTVYTPDKRDIPSSAASYSKNIDPLLDDGSLRGIPANTTHKTGVDSLGMSLINDSGTIRAVYMDSDGDIFKIDDLEGTPGTPTSLEAGTYTSTPAMAVHNKEVHIGLGTAIDAKWVGIISHGQFGGSKPSGLQIENAELTAPVSFTDMHKVVTDDTYIYGIEYGGQTLYKFKISDQTLTTSKPIFKNQADLTAIALASDGNIWLLDSKTRSGTTIGIVYKVDNDTLEVIQENKITLASNYVTHNYSDMIEIGAELWISAYKATASDPEKAYIINMTTPTASGDTASTNRLPLIRTDTLSTPATGKFDTATSDNNATMTTFIPHVNLIKLKDSTDVCGFAIDIRDRDGSASIAQFRKSGSTINVSSCILAIHKACDSSAHFIGSAISGDNNKLFCLGQQTGSFTPDQIFEEDTDNRGYVTSDGSTYIAISARSLTDPDDDSFVYRLAIPDMDTAANGDEIQTYQLGITTNITNGALCIADGGGGTLDYHIFSRGVSVGRWSIIDDVSGSFSSKTASVKLQSDANVVLSLTTSGASTSFTGDKNYFYKISYVYDGYQESPLSSDFMITQDSTAKQVSVSVDLYNTSTISKRISHINLYMAEGDEASSDPTGFYRLVKSIDISDQWVEVADDATSPDWGVKKTHQFLHNGTSQGSYEARTGISEALDNFTPNYTLSSVLNNQLYIANCKHPEIDDATHYIFKSRPYNYDQFNWAFDYLVLPDRPTAIQGFYGRLYAFTKSRMFRIEPNGMYVEDIFEGAGCLSSKSVIVTDYGMFFADDNNIYFHDGRVPQPIGSAIITQSETLGEPYPLALYTSWQLRPSPQRDVVLGFDNKRRALLIFFDIRYDIGSGNVDVNFCWAYSIDSKRWDLWDSEAVTSYVSGTSGENFISNGTNLYNYLGHASTKVAWQWYSKKIAMNATTVDKKFVKLHEQSDSGTPAVTIAFDTAPTTYGALSSITKAKWGRIKVIAGSTTDRLNALGIQWRELRETPITDP
jgi:hypothetical protein